MMKRIKKKTKKNSTDTIQVRKATVDTTKIPFTTEEGRTHPYWIDILQNFDIEDIQYYAGLMDGDGNFGYAKEGNIRMQISLTEEAAEPIIELAEKLDCTLSRIEYSKEYKIKNPCRANTKPWYYLSIPKQKAWFFLLLIYPYLLEKKERAKSMLADRFIDFLECQLRLQHQRRFSFPYLAGYADAEGHYKYKYNKGIKRFTFAFKIYSTDIGHIDYVGLQMAKLGFPISYSKITRHRLSTKPAKGIILTGLENLRKLYRKLLPFGKIKRKKRAMTMTGFYMDHLSPKYAKKPMTRKPFTILKK